jgi:glycosyltransferase involved in cell wall biosynthesis
VRFSVLVPTRGGGAYLRGCIDSVLAAAGDDVEVVVSDNANEDETASILAGYAGEARVRVVRQDTVLAVADNWNAAYRASRGDYVLMLGDDDALLPDCFEVLRRLLDAHDDPECLTYNAFSFIAPDAIAGLELAHYADPHFRFDDDLSGERELLEGERRRIVADMFRFRPRIPLNMQTTLVARRAYERVPDGPYRAPFPDHFALNALLLTAGRWVISPAQPLVVGVSSKSFGHHVYSDRQDAGLRYLGIDTDFAHRLPGSELLNGSYVWLLMLKRAFPAELEGVRVSRGDYVARQLYAWYRQARLGRLSRSELRRRIRALEARDLAAVIRAVVDPENARRLGQAVAARGRAEQLWPGLRPLPGVQNVGQFIGWLGSGAKPVPVTTA